MDLNTRPSIDIWLLLILWMYVTGAAPAVTRHRQHANHVNVRDKIIELQCFARCSYTIATSECVDQCRRLIVRQPRIGYCPPFNVTTHTSEQQSSNACHLRCQYDFDCAETQKCCPTGNICSSTCTDALGVHDNNLLPPIPKILKFKLPRGHKVEISVGIESSNTTFFCHVESRWHNGALYSSHKMGPWHWQRVEKLAEFSDSRSKRTDVAFNLKPSRWYQVRIAAINAHGFRGYSEPSAPFSLLSHPKPPKAPVDLTIISQRFDGNSYSVRIIWCPSKSNLPVEKYKVIWSLYVEKSTDQSYISNEAFVKDTNQYRITRLQPNSVYYIQVQAISKSGKRRLKSDTCSRLHNVTALETLMPFRPLNCSTHQYGTPRRHFYIDDIDDGNLISKTIRNVGITENTRIVTSSTSTKTNTYNVRFRLNRKFGMIVQIYGFQPHTEKVYELCSKETNCEQIEHSATRAKKNSVEFNKLKYNSTYVLKPCGYSSENSSSKPFIFQTPQCESFQKRFPKMHIKC